MNDDEHEHTTTLVMAPLHFSQVTPGSVITLAGCGHRVWASISAQDAMDDDPEMPTMCLHCFEAGKDMDDEETEVRYGTLPGVAFGVSEAMGIPLDKVDAHINNALEKIKEKRGAHRPQ